MRHSLSIASLTFASLLSSASLFADPIMGSFDIGGSSATVSQTAVDFNCTTGLTLAPCFKAPAGSGNFIANVATGDLVPYVNQGGYIKGLSEATTPLNTAFNLVNWITFSSTPGNPVSTPDVALDLQFLSLGVDGQADCAAAPAPGQTCTPIVPALVGTPNNPLGLSQFNLQNLPEGGSSASFAVRGIARKLSTGEISTFTGVFTASFDVPYQTELGMILGDPGFITHTYSASFIITPPSAVPEPKLMLLLMAGLVMIVVPMEFRRRQQKQDVEQ